MNLKHISKMMITMRHNLLLVFICLGFLVLQISPLSALAQQDENNRLTTPLPYPVGTSAKQLACLIKISRQLKSGKPTQALPKIVELLKEAASYETDSCHQEYLTALANQVKQQSFIVPIPQWSELEQNYAEILFFPRPEDKLIPADTVIYVNDLEETNRFRELGKRFTLLQNKLPFTVNQAVPMTGTKPYFKIAHLVSSSLPFATSLVYPASEVYNLPENNGFKIIVFKNVLDAYFDCIVKPLAQELIETPAILNPDHYLVYQILQKIAHQMGPVFEVKTVVTSAGNSNSAPNIPPASKDNGNKTIRAKIGEISQQKMVLISESLGGNFPLIENVKAKVVALHHVATLIEEGLLPPQQENAFYYLYIVDLIDALRHDPYGMSGKASTMQLNYYLKNGALTYSLTNRKWIIHSALFPPTFKALAKKVLDTFYSPYALIKDYGTQGQEIVDTLKRTSQLPLDIETRPLFPVNALPTPIKTTNEH